MADGPPDATRWTTNESTGQPAQIPSSATAAPDALRAGSYAPMGAIGAPVRG